MSIQVKDFTDAELLAEATEILEVGYTFHYEQDLTMEELVDHCRRIGDTDDDKLGYMPFNPKDNPDIARVMPTGLFGHSDLHWHANGTVHHLDEFKEILIKKVCAAKVRIPAKGCSTTKLAENGYSWIERR